MGVDEMVAYRADLITNGFVYEGERAATRRET